MVQTEQSRDLLQKRWRIIACMRGNILYRLIYSGVLQSAQFYLFMWLFWRTPSTLKIAKSSPPREFCLHAVRLFKGSNNLAAKQQTKSTEQNKIFKFKTLSPCKTLVGLLYPTHFSFEYCISDYSDHGLIWGYVCIPVHDAKYSLER